MFMYKYYVHVQLVVLVQEHSSFDVAQYIYNPQASHIITSLKLARGNLHWQR